MPRYKIENTRTGVIIGEFEAISEDIALDKMAQDAGYADYASACEVAPVAPGEIMVTEIRK